MRHEKFWAIFGKIALVIGVVSGSFYIIHEISKNNPKLVTHLEYYEYSLPPDLQNSLIEINNNELWEKTESILDTFYYNNRDNYKANKKITELIKNTIPKIYRYNHSSNYKFFYFFLIKNKSNEIAYDVILNGRILGICEIINHEKTIIEEFNNNVKLGDIRPKDEVIVKLWGGRISVTNVKNSFKISHTKGVSKIKVGGTVFGFSKWIFDNFIDLIFFIPMAILLIFALIIMIKPKNKSVH